MRMKYTDTDNCPVTIELTVRELNKLIELVQDAEGPYRTLRADLIKARGEAIECAVVSFEYERKRHSTKVTA